MRPAASLGASPHHVVVGGDAFSANLALALSIVCCHPRQERWAWELFERASPPRALLSFAGFLQTSAPERLSLGQDDGAHRLRALQSFSARYLQVDRRLPADAKLLADPLLLLEHVDRLAQPLPQCFAVVGEEDLVVPDTQRLESVYRKHHAVCCARYLPGRLVGRRSAGGLMAEPWVEEMHRFLGKDT
jgi:acetyl esterase/lipase